MRSNLIPRASNRLTSKSTPTLAFTFILACAFSLLLALSVGASDSPDPAEGDAVVEPDSAPSLRVVFVPEQGKDRMLSKFGPFCAQLEEALGMRVEPVCLDTFDETYDLLAAGEFDVAYFTPLNYVKASSRAQLEPAVMEYYRTDQQGYHSLILTRAGLAGDASRDKEKLVLAFPNQHSTSGYLMPQYYFNSILKQPPEAVAGKIVYARTHRAVIKGLSDGTYDMGATNDVDLHLMVEAGEVSEDDFSTLWVSDSIPGSLFCLRPRLDGDQKQAVTKAILDLNARPGMLKDLGVSGYVAATAKDYEIMFKLAEYYIH